MYTLVPDVNGVGLNSARSEWSHEQRKICTADVLASWIGVYYARGYNECA